MILGERTVTTLCASRLVALLLGVGSLGVAVVGCADSGPAAREVVISGESELEISMWCADPPPTEVQVLESATEVRVFVVSEGSDDCETAKTVTLDEPLGTRRIVDGRDGHLLAVSFDFRCQPSPEDRRCDDVPVGSPAEPLS